MKPSPESIPIPTQEIGEPLRLAPGLQLASYLLLERIGRGGEAEVWSVWGIRQEQVLALKLFSLDQGAHGSMLAAFEREAHLITSFDHPGILPLFEFGSIREGYFFAMRYIPTGSMRTLLRSGPVSPDTTLTIVQQIVDALEHVHSRGIVHRDLKPGNMLLEPGPRVFLSDFGLARELRDVTAVLHTGHGTGPYASPEQHSRSPITVRSDIFSLGVVIYEMLTGVLPWHGETPLAVSQHFSGEVIPDPRTVTSSVPPRVVDALRVMTHYDPDQRPASIRRAWELLVESFGEHGQQFKSARPSSPPLPKETLSRSSLELAPARQLLQASLQGWDANQEPYPISLSNFLLIESALSQAADLTSTEAETMLRGALTHGYRANHWALEVKDLPTRHRVFANVLMYEDDEAFERAVSQMYREQDSLALPPPVLERLIGLMMNSANTTVQNSASNLLRRSISEARKWLPVAISQEADTLLADIALSENPQAVSAARLIGHIRSEASVERLLMASATPLEAHLWPALTTVRHTARSLPQIVPPDIRFRESLEAIRRQLLEDRVAVTIVRLILGMVAGGLAGAALLTGLFRSVDLQFRDALYQPYPESGIVTIVAIGDDTLARYGRWDTWPRSLHAALVDRLSREHARVIALDVAFASVTKDDALLLDSISRAGNVIQPVLGEGDARPVEPGLSAFEGAIWPQPTLASAGLAVGHTNILHDSDGYVRRMPIAILVDNVAVPSLALAAVEAYLGIPVGTQLTPVARTITAAGRTIPVGGYGDMLIHYAGDPLDEERTTFHVLRYEDILDGRFDPALINGKIVLVGLVATAEPDRYLTPVSEHGRPMYGVEIIANAIETIWSGRFLHRPLPWVEFISLVMMGATTGLLATRSWQGLALSAFAGAAYFVLSGILFDTRGLVLSLFYPALAAIGGYVTVTTYRLSLNARQRDRLAQLFAARVSPNTARAALRAVEQGELRLVGQTQEVTALSVEMRSDPAASLPPQTMIEMVAEFRQRIQEAVFSYDGSVIRSEGGELGALFNTPLPQEDHPERGIGAALRARERIRSFQANLPLDHPFRDVTLGIGVATGTATVAYSSPDGRSRHVAVGEAITLAAQLANTTEPDVILISASSQEQAGSDFGALPLPPVAVRGRPIPERVFYIR